MDTLVEEPPTIDTLKELRTGGVSVEEPPAREELPDFLRPTTARAATTAVAGVPQRFDLTQKERELAPSMPLPERVVRGVVEPIVGGFGKTVEAIEDYFRLGTPTFYKFGEKGEKPTPVYEQDANELLARTIAPAVKGTGTAIAALPVMMKLNAFVSAIQPVVDDVAESIGEEEAQKIIRENKITDPATQNITRQIAKESAHKNANTAVHYVTAAALGFPVLTGVVVSDQTGKILDKIFQDTRLTEKQKETFIEGGSFLGFVGGMVAGAKARQQFDFRETGEGFSRGIEDVGREFARQQGDVPLEIERAIEIRGRKEPLPRQGKEIQIIEPRVEQRTVEPSGIVDEAGRPIPSARQRAAQAPLTEKEREQLPFEVQKRAMDEKPSVEIVTSVGERRIELAENWQQEVARKIAKREPLTLEEQLAVEKYGLPKALTPRSEIPLEEKARVAVGEGGIEEVRARERPTERRPGTSVERIAQARGEREELQTQFPLSEIARITEQRRAVKPEASQLELEKVELPPVEAKPTGETVVKPFWAVQLKDGTIISASKSEVNSHAELVQKRGINPDDIKSAGLINQEGKYTTHTRPQDVEERLRLITEKVAKPTPEGAGQTTRIPVEDATKFEALRNITLEFNKKKTKEVKQRLIDEAENIRRELLNRGYSSEQIRRVEIGEEGVPLISKPAPEGAVEPSVEEIKPIVEPTRPPKFPESGIPVVEKPKLPEFTSTEQALEFGRGATREQIGLLNQRRTENLKQFEKLFSEGKNKEAQQAALRAQFDREAVEANPPEGAGESFSYRVRHQIKSPITTADKLDDGGSGFEWKYARHDYNLTDPATAESYRILKSIKDRPEAEVTIYRAVPENVNDINPGDWVTLSRKYAQNETFDKNTPKVISKRVKASEIGWDGNDINEFAYYPDLAKKYGKPTPEGAGETVVKPAEPATEREIIDRTKGTPLFEREKPKGEQGEMAFSLASIAASQGVDFLPGVDDETKKILKGIIGIAGIVGIAKALSPKGLEAFKEIESAARRSGKTLNATIRSFLKSGEAKALEETDLRTLGRIAGEGTANKIAERVAEVAETTTKPSGQMSFLPPRVEYTTEYDPALYATKNKAARPDLSLETVGKLPPDLLPLAEDIVGIPMGRRTQSEIVVQSIDRANRLVKDAGPGGGKLYRAAADGAVIEKKLLEAGFSFLGEAREALKDYTPLQVVAAGKRIVKALEDRANAEKYLKNEAEIKAYQSFQKFEDFYRDKLTEAGFNTLDDYFPRRKQVVAALEDILYTVQQPEKNRFTALQQMLPKDVTSPHVKERTGVLEQYSDDPFMVSYIYQRSVVKMLAFDKFVKYYFGDFLNDVPPLLRNSPSWLRNREHIIRYAKTVLRPDRVPAPSGRIAEFIQRHFGIGKIYARMLDYNLRAGLVNRTQRDFKRGQISKLADTMADEMYSKRGELPENIAKALVEASRENTYLRAEAYEGRLRREKVESFRKRFEFFSIAETGNWDSSHLAGLAEYGVRRGAKNISELNELLKNPADYQRALVQAKDLAERTQLFLSRVARPEILEKILSTPVIRWVGMFKRFQIGQIEQIARSMKQEGITGQRALNIERRGFPEEIEVVEALRKVQYLREQTDNVLKLYKKGDPGLAESKLKDVPVEKVKQLRDLLSSEEAELNALIAKIEPTRDPAGQAMNWARISAKVFAITFAYNYIYGILSDAVWPPNKKQDRLQAALEAATLNLIPFGQESTDPQRLFVPPVIPASKYGVVGGIANVAPYFIPGGGIINRLPGRPISRGIQELFREEKKKTGRRF